LSGTGSPGAIGGFQRRTAAGAHLPYWALAAIWYCLNVVCLFAALHILASALESLAAKAGRQHHPRYSTAWWALRLWPSC
jgi:hypothetical protein